MANKKKISSWEEYQKMLNMSKANTKAEIASINQKAMANVDSYRKALGLQGSGAGASINAQIGAQQAQAQAQANALHDSNLRNAQESYSNSVLESYQNVLNNSSYKDAETWRKENVDESVLLPEAQAKYQSLMSANEGGTTWQNDKQLNIDTLNEQIKSGALTKGQQYNASLLLDELNKATTREEYNSLLEQYNNILSVENGVSNIADIKTQDIKNKAIIDSNTFDVRTLNVADAQIRGSKQDVYANEMLDKIKNGEIRNAIVNFNYGANQNPQFFYVDENGLMLKINSIREAINHANKNNLPIYSKSN